MPPEQYKEYLKRIVASATELGAEKVVIVSPPPIDDRRIETRKDAYTRLYVRAAREAASELGMPFINMWEEVHRAADMAHDGDVAPYLCDGLHLSKLGNEEAFRCITKALLEDVGWSALPLDVPTDGALCAALG